MVGRTKKSEQKEEYKIIDETPCEPKSTLRIHKEASLNPAATLKDLGIKEDSYDLSKIDDTGEIRLRAAASKYRGEKPTRSELRIVECRAVAYNSASILTPQEIMKTVMDSPDMGVIYMTNGVLEMASSIKEYSDVPLVSQNGEDALISVDDAKVMRGMMLYRNRVMTEYNVERPSEEELNAWIHMFIGLMIKTYTYANAAYRRGN